MSFKKKPELSSKELAEFYSSGHWFMFPRHFLTILSADEAIHLAFLINHAQLKQADSSDGWFYCKKQYVEEQLFFSFQKQKRLYTSLTAMGLIKSKWAGIPAKRWLKIDYMLLHELVVQADQDIAKRLQTKTSANGVENES